MKNTKNIVKTKTEWYAVIGNTINDAIVKTKAGTRIEIRGTNQRKFVGRGVDRKPIVFINGVQLNCLRPEEGSILGFMGESIELVEIVTIQGRKRNVQVIENPNFVKKNTQNRNINTNVTRDTRYNNIF